MAKNYSENRQNVCDSQMKTVKVSLKKKNTHKYLFAQAFVQMPGITLFIRDETMD